MKTNAELFQDYRGMVEELQGAVAAAARFGRHVMDRADPSLLSSNGPQAHVTEIGVAALQSAAQGAKAVALLVDRLEQAHRLLNLKPVRTRKHESAPRTGG